VAAEPLTVTDRVAAVVVPPLEFGSVTATCKKGEEAVGGGYGVEASRYTEPLTGDVPANLYPVLESYPSSTTSWTVRIFNRDWTVPQFPWTTARTVLVTAHVECISSSVGTQTVSRPVPVGSDRLTAVDCPAKTTAATGGGWRVTGMTDYRDLVDIKVSGPNPAEETPGWILQTVRPEGSVTVDPLRPVVGYAVCAGRSLTRGSLDMDDADAPRDFDNMATLGTAEVGCEKGELLTSAGHNTGPDTIGITTFFPRYSTSGRWVMNIYSLPALYDYGVDNIGARSIMLWAVCMTVT
jgi:hypothetical protein